MCVLYDPVIEQPASDQETKHTYFTFIADETGVIKLKEYGGRFLRNLRIGDTIRIIGVSSYSDHLLLSHFGVIEKRQEIAGLGDVPKLHEGPDIYPPNKNVKVEREQIQSGVKVILHRMHLLDDFTRLFLTIENMNKEKEVTFYRRDQRLFQGKKQFECEYSDDPHFKMMKTTIPSTVEQGPGVLLFEPLGDSQDPVRCHFKFNVEQTGYVVFDFDGINLSK